MRAEFKSGNAGLKRFHDNIQTEKTFLPKLKKCSLVMKLFFLLDHLEFFCVFIAEYG